VTERTYLIIDTETSGLKPENNGVCEIAWLEVSEEGEVLDQHYSLIDPEWPIAPAAQAVHGISQADVSEAPTLHEYFTIIHSEHPFDRDGLVFVAHNCVTGDHEVLTPEGWVRFDELGQTATVMQWDMKTQEMQYVECPVIKKMHEGEVLEWGTYYHKGVYTPEHRFVYKPAHKIDSPWGFAPAEEIATRGPNSIYIPAGGHYQPKEPLTLTPLEAQILEMIRADGNIEPGKTLRARFRFKKLRKVERCRELLDLYGAEYHYTQEGDVHIIRVRAHSGMHSLCEMLGVGKEKAYGRWLLELEPKARKALLDEVEYWDGWVSPRNQGGEQVQVHSSKRGDLEVLRDLAILDGRCAKLREEKPNVRGYSRPDSKISSLGIRTKEKIKTLEAPKRKAFSGEVFCVTVPSGAFLIRRNGATWVTGNCPFDWGFVGHHFPRGAEQMDTLALARRFYPDSDNHKLPTLAVMLGLETFDHKKAHGALADVRVLWEFVQKMQEDFGLTLEELLALANEFVPVETCTYKKHQGKPWVRVWVEDPDYVTWVSAQPWCRADLRKTLEMIQAGEL
jgi:DNA polymerase III epsilon subunit-like protein